MPKLPESPEQTYERYRKELRQSFAEFLDKARAKQARLKAEEEARPTRYEVLLRGLDEPEVGAAAILGASVDVA